MMKNLDNFFFELLLLTYKPFSETLFETKQKLTLDKNIYFYYFCNRLFYYKIPKKTRQYSEIFF